MELQLQLQLLEEHILLEDAGTSTAAINAFGQVPGSPYVSKKNESWDGTSWTETTDGNTARYDCAAWGTSTAALVMGGTGDPPRYTLTEYWDGSTWTELGDMATARMGLAGCGTSSSGVVAGGTTPPGAKSVLTEEWSDPSYTIKTVTVS